jgi:hypothetical protein
MTDTFRQSFRTSCTILGKLLAVGSSIVGLFAVVFATSLFIGLIFDDCHGQQSDIPCTAYEGFIKLMILVGCLGVLWWVVFLGLFIWRKDPRIACSIACEFMMFIVAGIICSGVYIWLTIMVSLPHEPCKGVTSSLECTLKTGTLRLLFLAGIVFIAWNVIFVGSIIWNYCRGS